jgi:copper(I)-binding protein
MKKRLLPATFAALAFVSGSLLLLPMAAAGDAAQSISIKNPYVRAVPPGQPNSAAFMALHNDSTHTYAIVSAESPAASIVELHNHVMEEGMMKMRQVEKIDLPAKGEAILQPGGLHVMLIGLKDQLQVGQSVDITLQFDDGSSKQIQAPVQKIQMKMHKHMH